MADTTITSTTTTDAPRTESNTQVYIWVFVGLAFLLVTVVALLKWYCRHKLIAAAARQQQDTPAGMAPAAAPPCQKVKMPTPHCQWRKDGQAQVASQQSTNYQKTKTERDVESGSTEE